MFVQMFGPRSARTLRNAKGSTGCESDMYFVISISTNGKAHRLGLTPTNSGQAQHRQRSEYSSHT